MELNPHTYFLTHGWPPPINSYLWQWIFMADGNSCSTCEQTISTRSVGIYKATRWGKNCSAPPKINNQCRETEPRELRQDTSSGRRDVALKRNTPGVCWRPDDIFWQASSSVWPYFGVVHHRRSLTSVYSPLPQPRLFTPHFLLRLCLQETPSPPAPTNVSRWLSFLYLWATHRVINLTCKQLIRS